MRAGGWGGSGRLHLWCGLPTRRIGYRQKSAYDRGMLAVDVSHLVFLLSESCMEKYKMDILCLNPGGRAR